MTITKSGNNQSSQVRPWVRFLARNLDISLSQLIIGFLLGLLLGTVFPDFVDSTSKNRTNSMILNLVSLAIYFVFEAILLSTWGTTPGKSLLKVHIRTTSGKKLDFFQALNRSFQVFVLGLGLGLPGIQLWRAYVSYKELTKRSTTIWDQSTKCVVSHQEIGETRWAIYVGVVTLLFSLLVSIIFMATSP